jgi:phospholipase/carboxylesterase
MPLARTAAPGAPLLSLRGKVLEHGMPRFFRRLAEGVFDEEDTRAHAHELADFIEAARLRYDLAAPMALGYSNGANIASAVMLLRPNVLAGGVLLRAMPPLANPQPVVVAGRAALIVSGTRDPMATPADATRLKCMLEQAGAQVDHQIVTAGHELSPRDVDLAREWLQAHKLEVMASS